MKKETNPTVDLILTIFLGWLGVHQFYRGKTGMCVLYLLTFGLFGVGWIIDIVSGIKRVISVCPPSSPSPHKKDLSSVYEDLQQAVDEFNQTPVEKMFAVKTEIISSGPPPGVSEEQWKKDLAAADDYYRNSPNPKFHRSEKEYDLQFEFYEKYGTQSKRMTSAFVDHARLAIQTEDLDDRIRLLEETIAMFYEARDWHYKKSKGGMLSFQDSWEHCHNSHNPDFCWIENEEAFLRESIFERNEVQPWIMQHAEEGFMQPEIYKAFPSTEQFPLRKAIDRLVSLGHISKRKEGKSYFISKAVVDDSATNE